MKTFKNLEIEDRYRSNKNNIYEEFYEKCLKKSIQYDRAVGYFTSGSLKLISKGLDKFIENKGKIRIITSPHLEEEDLNALEAGEELKLLENKLLDQWNNFIKEIEEDTLKVFSWMVAKGKLELKVAYQDDFQGLYHEKFGIFSDEEGNKIAFSGSVNETIGGMRNNFESIDTFNSLDGGKDLRRINDFVDDFDDLWKNNTNKLNIVSLPEAIKKNIIKFTPDDYELKNIIESIKEKEKKQLEIKEKIDGGLNLPNWLDVRPYQQEALDAWIKNKGRGILEMATGTGKTITALTIMTDMYKRKLDEKSKICYIVVCPQSYLVNQWSKEIENFNLENVICNSENNKWKNSINNKILLFNKGLITTFSIVTTTKTFQNKSLLRALKRIKGSVMLVVDECHNLGAKSFEEFLQNEVIKKIPYRLGLSATPDRQEDEEGNKIIKDYLGTIVYKFSLKEAIEKGFLTKYKYYPIYVSLTEKEEREYVYLSKKINSMLFIKNKSKETKVTSIEHLLFKRARLLNLAEEKLIKLTEIINPKTFSNLIYAGAGSLEDEEKNVNVVVNILRKKIKMNTRKFTSEENKEEREQIIADFENKKINNVVAIKCLDEGVNIPSIERAYILASTSNYREYVQRRGRVLRVSKETGKDIAIIYDFIVIPRSYYFDEYMAPEEYNIEKKLVRGELKRAKEYNSLSINKFQNEEKLLELKYKYKI